MNRVNFNFTVSAEDAQNIMDAIRDARNAALELHFHFAVAGQQHEANACKQHADYWETIIQTVSRSTTEVAP